MDRSEEIAARIQRAQALGWKLEADCDTKVGHPLHYFTSPTGESVGCHKLGWGGYSDDEQLAQMDEGGIPP